MLKSISRVSRLSFLVLVSLVCIACSSNAKVVTELNQTYRGSRVNITALEIKSVELPKLDSGDEMVVLVKFAIENTTKSDEYACIYSASVDGMETSDSFWQDALVNSEKKISVIITPGKRAEGYLGAVVPKGTKTIEFRVADIGAQNKYAVFLLDTPE